MEEEIAQHVSAMKRRKDDETQRVEKELAEHTEKLQAHKNIQEDIAQKDLEAHREAYSSPLFDSF